ncbi:MAG: hypothetical protein AAB592_05730 [Patescibacteria group bacterium]
MEKAVLLASVIGPVYLVAGLSMLLYRTSWQKVYSQWRDNHYTLIFPMVAYMILGLIMIGMYNVWEWNVWILVTLSGWALFVKGVLFFFAPGNVVRQVLGVGQNTGLLYLSGVIATVIGAVLSYYVYIA